MTWFRKLLGLLRTRQLDRDIDEELQFHLDSRIEDNRRSGLTEPDARRDAYARFGSRAAIRERTRDMNIFVHVERAWQDLRHGARVFARHPGFTAIAVLSIAFGTGANVAMFSVADTLLLRPLPVASPDTLVAVGSRVKRAPHLYQNLASYQDYLDIRARARSFDGVLAYDYETVGLSTGAGEPVRIRFASFVSDNFFQVLGVDLPLGRGFRADETSAATPSPVVVVSDAFWRGELNADPAVIGKSLRVGGVPYTVVGVTPASFTGLHAFLREAVFLPIGMWPRGLDSESRDVLENRSARLLVLKGRLRAGVGLAEAQAELATIGRDLERLYPQTNANQALIAQTEFHYKFEQRPLDASMIVVLLTLSTAVLCVACANVAGLLASRAPVRAREIALRLAVGANRARLVRQLITESLGIAVAGGACGLLVAHVGIVSLRQIQFPSDIVSPPTLELDQRVLFFSIVIAMASAIFVGLGPAIQTTRIDLATTLKATVRVTRRGYRLPARAVLVGTQVALSLVLVTIAVYAVQIFGRELGAGPGWRTTQLAKVSVAPGQARYTELESVDYYGRVLDNARALPGVRSASLTSAMPLFSFQFAPVVPEGRPLRDGETGAPAWANSVDEQYFDTMGIAVMSGRVFRATDDAAAPRVAIINTTLARHYWPDLDPIGRRLDVLDQPGLPFTVVGVVETTTYGFQGELPQDAMYFPFRQRPRTDVVILARTEGDSSGLVEPLRGAAQRADPDVPVFDAQTIETFYEVLTRQLGTVVRLIGGIGLMGLVLTMVGLYGLVAYAVNRRTREIGIRIAIGATYRRIVQMVLRQGLTPVWYGVLAGLVLSAVTARTLLTLVPIHYRLDSRTYLFVVPMVVIVTIAAAFIPARRAARVDPTTALRCD